MASSETKARLKRVAEQLLFLANEGNDVPNTSVFNTAGNSGNPSATEPREVSPAASAASEHRRLFNYGSTRLSGFTPRPATTFLSKGKAATVHTYLMEKYTPLSLAGGYELLLFQRGGENRGFYSLPTPYSPSRLKDIAGQATIYIRPLQKDILADEARNAGQSTTETGPSVECLMCDKLVPMHQLRQHQMEEHKEIKKRPATDQLNLDEFMASGSGSKQRKDSNPGPSTVLTEAEQINQLKEMFPDWSENNLKSLLDIHGDAHSVALSISRPENTNPAEASDYVIESDDDLLASPFTSKDDAPVTLQSLLNDLKCNLLNERVKLKVDQEDLLNDAMTFYKDPDFDPRKRLRVIFNNQPAADTGGVTRQFFTQLLGMISDEFFQGVEYKQPIYNSNMVACGIIKLCGKIIVHSILLGGPGLPIFSPGVYDYLVTGRC
ncbi:hypothetical protein OS493_024034 [Desmophyllum pertusum]|uniref:HECT domain-containing protein n=1 Tax=Desmophyllum pertusum TaxID=174260 RepID=A0A9W9ZLR8_9CNID|nr:hypothetical protein OS493_024034 [Desmophyllum pertusum]